jgi:hypothetical protein
MKPKIWSASLLFVQGETLGLVMIQLDRGCDDTTIDILSRTTSIEMK